MLKIYLNCEFIKFPLLFICNLNNNVPYKQAIMKTFNRKIFLEPANFLFFHTMDEQKLLLESFMARILEFPAFIKTDTDRLTDDVSY